ncbi:uncharacterized protein JCM15063_000913 [Sporobolomyces koalae]|uniref:uncharacterized protein n=1 Tax=Sporobolomyces koalae TaxID=500713 RepID=UPI00317DCE51
MSGLLHHKSVRLAKPTHGHQPSKTGQIRPDHEIVDRLQQWKHIDKSLLHYYKGLAHIEHAASKSTLALNETIQVPFHEGHGFLGEGGWQEVLYEVRDNNRLLADKHQSFADEIEQTVVRELEGVRSELKSHIAAIEKEASALADSVEHERGVSVKHLTELQSGIDTFENSNVQMLPQKDPYLSHSLVQNQLKKQVHKENDLQAALIRFQQQQASFEEGIAKSIQSACKLYEDARKTHVEELDKIHVTIASALQRVDPKAEWEHYISQESTNLIDPNTPSRSIEAITFPGLDHASTRPLREGYLERKKRFTKKYTESYYVLTPSGYLHERRSPNSADTTAPGFSLFLPECSLSAPAKASDKSHKFHVEGNKAVKSSFESKVKNTLRFGGKEIAYTFRARTHSEMLAWHEEIDHLSRDTKTASEPRTVVSRDPVAAAVTNVGLSSGSGADVASSVAATPGDRVLTGDEAERAERHAEENQSAAVSTFGEGAVAPSNKSVVIAAPSESAAYHEHPEEEDSEEGGGSSEDEYATDDELARTRTAPTTPAAGQTLTSNPLEHAHVNSEETGPQHMRAETLPAYVGNGVSQPEKAALQNESKGAPPPILGEPLATSSHGDSSAPENHHTEHVVESTSSA